MKPESFCAVSCATKLQQADHAARYCDSLLEELGIEAHRAGVDNDHPAIAWKRSGLFELSGAPDGRPRMVPMPIASAADGALEALRVIAPKGKLPDSGAALLGERARMMGLKRNGRASPGGHCRLIECADGRIALNLAREDDWELLPALLQDDARCWDSLTKACRDRTVEELVHQGIALGMAIAKDALPPPNPWLKREQFGERRSERSDPPLVVDLSALWAGPLAGSLLQMCSAEVIKIESTHRPDGARNGDAGFYCLLNAGKRSVALDFRSESGRNYLKKIIDHADIVIEASRPRALEQLGIVASELVASRRGKVWVRMLAHGEDPNRIGFGDDIGVAAGLSTVLQYAWGDHLMVGDAMADPLSGLHAAIAAWQSWLAGGGELLTVSMRDTVRHVIGTIDESEMANRAQEWQAIAEACDRPGYPLRHPISAAEAIGQSNAQILERLC